MAASTIPALVSLTLPGAIDFSTTKTMEIGAHVLNDSGAGLSYIIVAFNRPLVLSDGAPDQIGALDMAILSPGSASASTLDDVFGVGPYSAPGVYHVTMVTVADGANNLRHYDTAQLEQLGIQTSFTVTGTTPDLAPPHLTSLSLPMIVDASRGPAPVTFKATASDDLSGVLGLTVWMDHDVRTELFPYNPASYASGAGISFDNGFLDSWVDGKFAYTTMMDTPAGIYNIDHAEMRDKAGNTVRYSAVDLAKVGINTSMRVDDGKFVANALGKQFAIEPRTADHAGEIVLKLSADRWLDGKNTFKATFTYDPTVASFDGWRAGAVDAGGYSVQTTVAENGKSGQVTLTAAIDNHGQRLDFLELRFQPAATTGSFAVGVSGARLNGETLANDFQSHVDFNVPLLRTGGAGLDTVRYAGKAAGYLVTHDGDALLVKPVGQAGADEKLVGVERIAFADQAFAFDGVAAQGLRLYQAAFDRKPDAAGLGYWIDALDHGASLRDVARNFVLSDEFAHLYGAHPTNAQLVAGFYQNVLHRAGDAAGVAYWTDALDHRGVSAADVLADFSESPENQAQLAPLVAQGVAYVPFA